MDDLRSDALTQYQVNNLKLIEQITGFMTLYNL